MNKSVKKVLLLVITVFLSLSLSMFFACGGKEEEISSEPVKVEDFSLNITNNTIYVGETFILSIDNSEYADSVEFSSENTSIASVSSNGTVTGISMGTTNIVASVGDISKKCAVVVQEEETQDELNYFVSLFNQTRTLKVGESCEIIATIYLDDEEVENEVVEWSVSDPSVCEITEDGNKIILNAVKAIDSLTIRATFDKFVASCTISIKESYSLSITSNIEGVEDKSFLNLDLPLNAESIITFSLYNNEKIH